MSSRNLPLYSNPPLQTSGWNGMNVDLSSFFGGQIAQDAHPYDHYNESTWALPESMIGDSVMLKNTFELIALTNNSFLLTTIMPLRMTNKVRGHWASMEYVPALAASTPFLGVTRQVQSNRKTGSQTMRRVGLGAFFEDGFLNGPDGDRHFAMTLRQISQGFLEGMQFDALAGLIESGNQELDQYRRLRGGSSANNRLVNEIVSNNELFRWGIFQQEKNPWPVLMDHIQDIVRMYNGANLDTILADTKCALFLRNLVFSKQAAPDYVSGNPQNRLTDGIENFYTDPQGRRVYLVRRLFSEGIAMSPMQRQTHIGEMIRSYNHADKNPEKYSTSLRTVRYYDMTIDGWNNLTLSDMIDNSMRFAKDSGRLLSIGNARQLGQIPKNAKDFLHSRDAAGNLVPINFFGDMQPEDLTLDDVAYNVDTCTGQLQKREMSIPYSSLESAFTVIAEALAVISRIRYTPLMDQWLRVLSFENQALASNAGGNKHSSGSLGLAGNEWGSLRIPSTRGEYASWVLPPTHGDYGGFKTIQSMINAAEYEATGFSVPYGRKIAEAMVVFDSFADTIRHMYIGTPIANGNFVNGNIEGAGYRHAIFNNVFHLRNPVSYLYLHRVNDVTGTSTLRGTNIPTEAQATELLTFEPITVVQNFILNKFLGPLIPSTDALDNQTFIGEPISRVPGGAVNYRYNTTIPRTDYPQFALARYAPGDIPAGDAPFDSTNDRDSLQAASADRDFVKIVYDVLARWSLIPVSTPAQYAVRGLILGMFSTVKRATGTGAANARTTANHFAAFIDALQGATGIRLDRTDDPEGAGNNAAFREAVSANADGLVDRIVSAFKSLRQRRPTIFNTKTVESTLDKMGLRIKDYIASAVVNPPSTAAAVGWAAHLNKDITVYVPAPVSLGRRAVQDYLVAAFADAGIRYAIPASFANPSRPMLFSELEMARNIASETSADVRLSYLKRVGSIFAKAEDVPVVSAMIDFIPAIVNTKVRIPTADEQHEINEQRRARIAAQTSVSSLGSSLTEFDALLNDNSREDSRRGSYTPVATTPVSKHTIFNADEISNNLATRVGDVLRHYADKHAAQAIALCFLTTQITRQALRAFERFNISIPFNFLCLRPHQRYTTSSLIAMVAGSATCEMAFGNVMVTFGADATIQATTLTARLFHAPFIYEPNNIFVVHNVLVTEYHGGSGSGFIKVADYNPMEGVFGASPNDSFIIMLMSCHGEQPTKAIHLSGHRLYSDRQGNIVNLDGPDSAPSYSVAAYYNAIWNFAGVDWKQNFYGALSGVHAVTINDLCYSALALSRDPFTNEWEPISHQQGHWKDKLTFDNCRPFREGKSDANLDNLPHEGGRSLVRA